MLIVTEYVAIARLLTFQFPLDAAACEVLPAPLRFAVATARVTFEPPARRPVPDSRERAGRAGGELRRGGREAAAHRRGVAGRVEGLHRVRVAQIGSAAWRGRGEISV